MPIATHIITTTDLGDRIMKVDHAGEHGAVCIYRSQRFFARWRAPDMVAEIDEFIAHERSHRARFAAELQRRNKARCRSYYLCALGGMALGAATGLAGRQAIAATTVAIERVVLRHMQEQIDLLEGSDPVAVQLLRAIIVEEQLHHDQSLTHLGHNNLVRKIIDPLVTVSTEVVIWLGMNL